MTLRSGPNLGLLVDGAAGEQHYTELMRQWRGMDCLMQAVVISAAFSTPPASPADGDAYIVAASPSGAWAGKAGKIARWSVDVAAWEFYTAKEGWSAYVKDAAKEYRFDGADWVASSGGGGSGGPELYDTAVIAAGAIDLSDATISTWLVSLGSNVTSVILPAAPAGEILSILILFKQDVTGSRTVSGWPTVNWESGSAPTIATAANSTTSIPLLILGNGDVYGVS